MKESEYLTAVYAFTYLGPVRTKLLLSYFKSAKKIWESPAQALIKTGIPHKKVEEFIKFRNGFDIKKYHSELKKHGVKVTTFLDSDFPKSIIELEGAPLVIYYRGSLKGLKANSVAIVGARKITPYGKAVAEKFSRGLSTLGITIISGLARGVDTVAHKACIATGGITVAVMGHGLDRVYPPENVDLSQEIVKKGGAIISEYPLGYPVFPGNFTVRNRIVSGLADCVLVIEGAERSGTLLTASHAANQGKTVFAVPGEIFSPFSKAPHFLLKNGARIATDIEDVLDEFDLERSIP